MDKTSQNDIVVAITGASGSMYALRLLSVLLSSNRAVHLLISSAAREVLRRELELTFPDSRSVSEDWAEFVHQAMQSPVARQWGFPETVSRETGGCLRYYDERDFSAGIASGSFLTGGMVICPCSMGTLSSIATGASANLIHRAADVHLKERRPLLLVPRECPLSLIQTKNMGRVIQAGATIMPAMPGFYHQPRSIADLVDFIVARICDHLYVPHALIQRWGHTGNQES